MKWQTGLHTLQNVAVFLFCSEDSEQHGNVECDCHIDAVRTLVRPAVAIIRPASKDHIPLYSGIVYWLLQ